MSQEVLNIIFLFFCVGNMFFISYLFFRISRHRAMLLSITDMHLETLKDLLGLMVEMRKLIGLKPDPKLKIVKDDPKKDS